MVALVIRVQFMVVSLPVFALLEAEIEGYVDAKKGE